MKGPRHQSQKPAYFLGALLLFPLLGASQALFPFQAHAQEDDPGLIRSLTTDSASVENSYYLSASVENNTVPYHSLYLYGEGLVTLVKDFGLEADFPALYTREPLGQVPLVLGPVGLYARYEAFHFGGWSSETAGVLSFQGGAAYATPKGPFPYLGSSWSLKALAGYRLGKLFIQGNYGFQGGIDPKVLSEWQANTSLGYGLGSNWYLQAEVDYYYVTSPFSDSSASFVPQIAFQPGEWLFEFGESFSDTPGGTTKLLVARTF